jgi:hypothetical protein
MPAMRTKDAGLVLPAADSIAMPALQANARMLRLHPVSTAREMVPHRHDRPRFKRLRKSRLKLCRRCTARALPLQ